MAVQSLRRGTPTLEEVLADEGYASHPYALDQAAHCAFMMGDDVRGRASVRATAVALAPFVSPAAGATRSAPRCSRAAALRRTAAVTTRAAVHHSRCRRSQWSPPGRRERATRGSPHVVGEHGERVVGRRSRRGAVDSESAPKTRHSAADAWQNFATPHQIKRDQVGRGRMKERANLRRRLQGRVTQVVDGSSSQGSHSQRLFATTRIRRSASGARRGTRLSRRARAARRGAA